MSTARFLLWLPANNAVLLAGDALPSIDVPSAARVVAIADRWCRAQRLDARVIAVVGAIGRSDGSLDWGVWLRTSRPVRGYDARGLPAFVDSAPDPIDRRLARALLDIVTCARTSTWIGFNQAWPELVRAWISKALELRCDDVLPLRADVTALVAKCNAASRSVFFTARPLPFRDPELCDVLRDHSPASFPHTIAWDSGRGWWLTADIGGLDAARYVQPGESGRQVARLLEAIAAVQVSTLGSRDLVRLSSPVTRDTVIAGVARLFEAIRTDVVVTDDEHASILVEVANLWDAVGGEQAPTGWVHSDPAPDNIRIDDEGRIVFLDLEDPWYGPVPLMGALAIHSLRRRNRWRDDEFSALGAEPWRRYVTACGLAKHGSFEAWLRLAQLVRLIRRVDRSATESALLLEEEVPRRSRAIRAELGRLCGR